MVLFRSFHLPPGPSANHRQASSVVWLPDDAQDIRSLAGSRDCSLPSAILNLLHVWIFKFRLKITSFPQCPTRALKGPEKSIVAKEFHLKLETGERKDGNGHVMLGL